MDMDMHNNTVTFTEHSVIIVLVVFRFHALLWCWNWGNLVLFFNDFSTSSPNLACTIKLHDIIYYLRYSLHFWVSHNLQFKLTNSWCCSCFYVKLNSLPGNLNNRITLTSYGNFYRQKWYIFQKIWTLKKKPMNFAPNSFPFHFLCK